MLNSLIFSMGFGTPIALRPHRKVHLTRAHPRRDLSQAVGQICGATAEVWEAAAGVWEAAAGVWEAAAGVWGAAAES